jgi:hypothetical protein
LDYFTTFPVVIALPILTNSYGDLTNYNLIVKQKIASILKKKGLFKKKWVKKIVESQIFIKQG